MYDQEARERHDHALLRVLRRLKYIIPCCKRAGHVYSQGKLLLSLLTHWLQEETAAGKELYISTKQHVRFKSWKLRIEGKVHGNGIISGYDKGKKAYGSPLAILSVVKKEEGIEALAKREVPQSLYLILTSYSGNSYLEQYEGFVIRLDGTRIRIGKAIFSRTYLERIRRHGSAGKDLLFLRSVEFDIVDLGGRRGIARLIVALYRHIADSKQGKIIGKVSGGQDKQSSSQQMVS